MIIEIMEREEEATIVLAVLQHSWMAFFQEGPPIAFLGISPKNITLGLLVGPLQEPNHLKTFDIADVTGFLDTCKVAAGQAFVMAQHT
ncbi:unnamed protein product [Symbiodinium sp. CCMP2592]|nr:unnamed protein product [Symbiodinium sp. CCMP2592]